MNEPQTFDDVLKGVLEKQQAPKPPEQVRPASSPPPGALSAPAQPPNPPVLAGVAAPEPIARLAAEPPADAGANIFNDPKAQIDSALGMIEALRSQEPTPPQLELLSQRTGIPLAVLRAAPPDYVEMQLRQPEMRAALEEAAETRSRIIADAEAALVLRGELPAMAASEQALARLGMEWRAPYAQPQMIPAPEQGEKPFGQGLRDAVGRSVDYGRSAVSLLAAETAVQTIQDLEKTLSQVLADSLSAPVERAAARGEDRPSLLPPMLQGAVLAEALSGVLYDVPTRLWNRLTSDPQDVEELAALAARRMTAAVEQYRAASDVPMSDVARSFAARLDAVPADAGLLDSATALVSAMADNSAGAAAFFAEVMAEQTVTLGAQVGASVLTRRPLVGVGTGVALTYGQEAYRLPVQMLKDDFGIDVLGDPQAPQKLLTNPEALAAVEEFGRARGVPIAVAQLLSLGIASRAGQGGTAAARAREVLGVAAGQFVFDFTGEALAMMGSEGRIVWTEALIEGIAGTVIDTPIDIVTTSTDIVSARRDEAKLRSFLETGQEISGNLRGMDPGALSKAAEILGDRMTREGIDRVYVDADALNRFNQDNPDIQVAATLGISPEALAEAVDEGADIEINARTFMRHILGREGFDALIEHTRLDPDGPKAGEVDDIDASIEQSIEEQMAAAEQRFAANGIPMEQLAKLNEDVDQITRDVADQLRATGRFTEGQVQMLAETTAKRYAARAVRARTEGADVDALSLYLEDNVRIQGQRPDTPPSFDQESAEPVDVALEELVLSEFGSAIARSAVRSPKFKYEGKGGPVATTRLPNGKLYLLDGYHRVTMAQAGGETSIQARVFPFDAEMRARILDEDPAAADQLGPAFEQLPVDEDGVIEEGETRLSFTVIGEDGPVRISEIVTPQEQRGQGQATRALRQLIDRAKAEGRAVELLAAPQDDVTEQDRLVEWYKSLGFEDMGGDPEGGVMMRLEADEDASSFLFQSAVPLQEQPLVIEGTGPGGRVLNRDLGRVFAERHMAAYGRALNPDDPADYDVILDSLMQDYEEQARQPDTGDAWYTDDINEAIRLTEAIYPELANQEFRDLFLTATALLSPQQKPRDNWGNAIHAMRSWKETGRLELLKPNGKQFGVRSHTTGLQLLQHLIDTQGLENALKWVQDIHTGREMAEMRKASGLFAEKAALAAYTPNELNLQSEARGIYMFGPKVGDFMQNSVGIDQNAVTVDLWMARTYNRYLGRLLDTADGNLVGDVRTPGERAMIKRIVRDAASRAGIDPSAMQAALWYFEQRLYRSHGIRADSQNFSDAAATALKERGLTDGRSGTGDQQAAGGAAGSGPATGTPRPVATPGARPGGADPAGAVRGGRPFARQEGVPASPLQPLPGAPKVGGAVFGPIPELVAIAEAYAASLGDKLKYRRQPAYVQVNPARGARIAQAYEEAKHDPDNSDVRRAYSALIEQTRAQYDALVAAGYEFTFFGNDDDPYAGNPWDAMRDLRDNKRMAVYSTMAGYGTDQTFDPKQHALLRDTGLVWKDQQGNDVPVLANDLFRAVHDAFGHGLEGAGFRARGEENAWQAHVRLFYGEAVKAITTETRGQNSWLNFGPYAETNQTASLQETVFADQKMTLLPSWTWTEGRVGLHGLPINDDGTVTLTHFSPTQGLTDLDPAYHGTGLPGDERARKTREGWVDRTYFGVSVGKEGGYQPEFAPGTPVYEARVPAEAIYDYQQDPDALLAGVKDAAITHRRADGNHLYDQGLLTTLYEKAIFDAGYEAYFNNSAHGLTVAKFTPTPVAEVGARQDPAAAPAPEPALAQSAGGARGGFTPSDLINDQNGNPVNLIEIFESGDVSTFLHESGHFWLEQLKADAGRFKGQFGKDWQAVIDWWGTRADAIRAEALDRARRAGDTEAVSRIASMSDQALSTFIGRGDLRGTGHTRWVAIAMHEQFARGAEDYFRSGEAPSVDLVDAFHRFAAWLTSVYRTIQRRFGRDGLDVKFAPEVKQVLDRMLATDAEIEVVSGQYDLASLFDTAADAGMSPEQFNQHTQRIGRAKGRAKQRLLAKHLREIERVRLEWWKSEREGMRRSVEAAIANMTPMRLLWSLAHGGLADGSSALATEKLDRINKQALIDMVGAAAVEALPRAGTRTIYVSGKEGASPGAIATAFGYPDVETMVLDLQELGGFKDMVERELDQRMETKHGLLQDNIAEEAVAAIHGGDSAGRLLAAELAALRTSEEAVDLKFIKAYARKKMGKVKLADLREAKYLAAEKRHAKEAGRAVRAGKRSEAYKQQFQRLVNHYMAKEARKRREQHAKNRDYLSQFKQPRKKFPTIAADYVDKIKVSLDSIDFGPRLSDRKRLQLEMAALNAWVQRKQEEDGAILEVPPLIQQKDALTNWRDMTVDEFETMVDWVKQLETQGRLLNKLRYGKELRDRREVLANLSERLNNMSPALAVRARSKVASADEMSLIGKGAHYLAGLDAALLKAEFLLEQLDGEPLGPWHTAIFQPISEAAAQKGNLMAEVSQMIQKRLDALPKEVRKGLGKRVSVGNLGKPGMKFTRGNLIMLALNTGNESNLDKLIRGYKEIGWNINEDMLKAAVNQLSKEEWDLIQAIWDHSEKLWPSVENIYRRENGRSPERIQPIEIETPHGSYRGGYFPMFYDSSYGGKAEQIETGDALEMFQAQHNRAGVNSSMTKERSSQFAAPVNLSIELLPQAFDRTIHFITHYDAVRSIRRIMSDPDLVQQFNATVGPEYKTLLQSWLGAVAANLMDQPMTNKAQRAVDVLSRNTTAAILGFSYTTLAAQMMGLTVAIDRLAADTTYGPINVARVTADVVSGLTKAVSSEQRQRVMDLSGEMRHRLGQQDRDLRRMLRQSRGKSGLLHRAREVAGLLIAGLQFYTVDLPVWLASYNRALRAGEDTGRAVQYADRVVRISQSGGDVKDLAAVQRDKGAMRAFTLFYSFFSVMYGVTKGLVGEVNRNPLTWVRATARILILYTMQEIMMELIRGNALPEFEPDDEDEEGLIEFAAKRTAAGMLQTVPLARDIASGLISDFGFSPTPVGAFGEALVKTVANASEVMEKAREGEDLDDFSLNDLKPLVMGVSIGLGIPGGVQVNRLLDGLQALRDEEDGWNYFDLLNGYDETQAEE